MMMMMIMIDDDDDDELGTILLSECLCSKTKSRLLNANKAAGIELLYDQVHHRPIQYPRPYLHSGAWI